MSSEDFELLWTGVVSVLQGGEINRSLLECVVHLFKCHIDFKDPKHAIYGGLENLALLRWIILSYTPLHIWNLFTHSIQRCCNVAVTPLRHSSEGEVSPGVVPLKRRTPRPYWSTS